MKMSQQKDTFHIFISYARADNTHAEIQHFVTLLEKVYTETFSAALNIFFDVKDIEHGEDWERCLHTSLKKSHLMLAFISESYMASEWCRKEWRVWCEVERSRGCLSSTLFPVYYTHIPDAFQRIENFTFTQNIFTKENILQQSLMGADKSTDEDACMADMFSRQLMDITTWKQLDESQRQEQVKGFVTTLHKKIQQVESATSDNGQFVSPNVNFRGRIYELKALRACFAKAQSGRVPVIHGVGGEGKTALAIAYGHAFAYDYPGGRFLIHCEGMESLKECFYKLASELSLQLSTTSHDGMRLQEIWQWLQHRPGGRCLVIFDYIDNIDVLAEKDLASIIRADDNVHILTTTRCACHSLGTTAIPIRLGSMQTIDALDALAYLRPFKNTEKSTVIKIIRSLGAHALSIQLGGAFLRENEDISYEDFATELSSEGVLSVLEHTTEVAKNINYTALQSIEKLILPSLEKFTPEEKNALQLMALLAPENVIAPWIQEALEMLYPKTMRSKGLKKPWSALVRKCNGLCLWQEQENKNIYHMHRLVREVIYKQLLPQSDLSSFYKLLHDIAVEKAEDYKDGTLSWSLAYFLELLPTLTLWSSNQENMAYVLCLPEILVSKILRGTGHEGKCVELITALLNFILPLAQNAHMTVFTAAVLASRGQCLLTQGFGGKALEDYTHALEMLENIGPEKSPLLLQKTAEIYDYAGEAERMQGNTERALQLHHNALDIFDALLQQDNENVISWEVEKCYTLDHIARTYNTCRDAFSFQKAHHFFMQSLTQRENICKAAPHNLRFLRDLANSYEAVGALYFMQKNEMSEEYYEKSLEIRQKLHEKDENNIIYKRDLSIAYNHKGDALLLQKNIEEAITFFTKALVLRKGMFHKDTDNYHMAYDYSFSLVKVGDASLAKASDTKTACAVTEAITYYEDAKKIRQTLLAKFPGKREWSRGLASVHYKCATAYMAYNDRAQARENLLHAQDILKNILLVMAKDSPQRPELQSNFEAIQQKLCTVDDTKKECMCS